MIAIKTIFKEEEGGRAKAIIHDTQQGWLIKYYDTRGSLMKEELHAGKSLQWAEDAAENWALGIKVLNG
ncbi:hypothetical protein OAG36_00395 [bacterium]|jgi:hypothetical protein|nr:hypothetical protein [bacterium]